MHTLIHPLRLERIEDLLMFIIFLGTIFVTFFTPVVLVLLETLKMDPVSQATL